MSNDTIIDRDFIEQAVDQSGVDLIPDYSEHGWFAIQGTVGQVLLFALHLAAHDPGLAMDLSGVMKSDELYSDSSVWWFPGFKLEPIDVDD